MGVKATEKRTPRQMFLLDRARKRSSRFASLDPHVVTTIADVRDSVAHARGDSLWVSYASDLTDALVRSASQGASPLGFGLFLHSVDMKTIPALSSFFRRVAFTSDGGFIPAEELAEVLEADNRSDLFIGGSANPGTETITFWRGDLKPLAVPFSAFEKSGNGTEPDFTKFARDRLRADGATRRLRSSRGCHPLRIRSCVSTPHLEAAIAGRPVVWSIASSVA